MPLLNNKGEIRAAGGIVTHVRGGVVLILMVYRQQFEDWSLPKGKVKRGELDEDTALREVLEETGLHCKLGEEVGSMHYLDRRCRVKVARYWLMEPAQESDLRFDNEVDAGRWLPLQQARDAATRSGDRDFLAELYRCLVIRGGSLTVLRRVHVWEKVREPKA
jgi:8-oxo-dGTP pyrophosphatase MutT (NUDIX family)